VIHKSSRFTADETAGFTAAADDRELHAQAREPEHGLRIVGPLKSGPGLWME
jgi:hypothetical protein